MIVECKHYSLFLKSNLGIAVITRTNYDHIASTSYVLKKYFTSAQINSFFLFQVMFHISGHPVVSVISKVVKTALTLNLRTSSGGSGPPTAKRSNQLLAYQPDGATTLGRKLDTKNKGNLTMLSLISTVPLNHVYLFSTTYTMMVLLGMMLLATTRNPSFVKIQMNY